MSQLRTSAPERPAWPSGRELLYILDDSRIIPESALAIQIYARDRKKSGDWKKHKPLSLSHEMLPIIPDPKDREIIARFMGVKRETWYRGAYESICRFQPKKHDLLTLLPLISSTDRLYFRTPKLDGMTSVHWDDSEPWEFQIDVIPDEQGNQYEICGAFYRSSERLSLSQIEFLFREGILILNEKIANFRGSYDWIEFFRKEGPLFVPYAEADQWLETMLSMQKVPSLNLPEELRLEEIQAVPRPVIHIRPRKEPWNHPNLAGEVFFDYMGHTIEERNPDGEIALIPERRKILRNREIEAEALDKIENAGFRRQRSFVGKSDWTIPPSRLPIAVRDLTAAGWHVEAEGKVFRNPSPLSFHIASGIDWFELHGSAEFGDCRIPLPRLLAALKRQEHAIRLNDGSFGILPEEWSQTFGILAGLGNTQDDHIRFQPSQAGLLDALLASKPEVSCDDLFENVRRELNGFREITADNEPAGFSGTLRPYQREGLGWLHFLQRFGFGGCLADDMGLGKTIQVLALLEERRCLRDAADPSGSLPPSLVVMPRSLVFNWHNEACRFTPEIRVLEHTGGERIRGHEHFDDYDVVFTTYGTLRRDAPFFKDKLFDYVILDEAQAIKNASTESAKAARLLKGQHRLALSGTPIENHLGELWSLFEFLNPGMLGSASVLKLGAASGAKLNEEYRSLLSHALRPFILRRTKSQVAPELPAKSEQTLFCQLETGQRKLYNELRDHYRGKILSQVDREGIQKSKMHILEALLRLRQAAIHPGLIDGKLAVQSSAKLDMLLPQLVEVLDEGHKALVFSQFTSMLDILRQKLEREEIPYEYLDGKTKDRSSPVERFQNGSKSKLFLISLKAGGLGLNLTAAEYVFLLDPWWNPAVEAQAIDRTHRIGQTRPVFAYRLIAKDTVEEKVLELQDSKRKIADAIINQDNSILQNIGKEDLEILLS
jgi:superfamily II DNA or RNA helicase